MKILNSILICVYNMYALCRYIDQHQTPCQQVNNYAHTNMSMVSIFSYSIPFIMCIYIIILFVKI